MVGMFRQRLSTAPRRRLAALLWAALPAAALVAGCGSTSAPNGATSPPVLHIDQAGAADAARLSGASEYTLVGALPATPTSGSTYRWNDAAASSDDVRRVAATFGITTTPVRAAHGWRAVAATGTVLVRDGDGQPWVYLRKDQLDCPPVGLDVDSASADTGVACAKVAPPVNPTTSVPPVAPTVTAARALAVAQPVLSGLAISGTPRAIAGNPAQVISDSTVDGLEVLGLSTTVGVDDLGIASASGRLLDPTKSDTYPLRTAQASFDELKSRPVPLIAELCPDVVPDATGSPVCGSPVPVTITGATYGLMLERDAARPILAPAWMFVVSGSEVPLVVLAVDPKYIAAPSPASATGSAPGAGTSGGPGSAEPGSPGALPTPANPPAPVTPVPGAPARPGVPTPASVVVAVPAPGGDELSLVSWRGACDTDPAARVVSDGAARLVVSVTVIPPAAGTVCTAQAVSFVATVRLARPLNDRLVIDASTGKPVKVDPNYALPR